MTPRDALIAAGLLTPARDDDPVTPFTSNAGKKLLLDAIARELAAQRIAHFYAHGPAWEEFAVDNVELKHLWDKDSGLVCVRCGVYMPMAEDFCEGEINAAS